MSGKHVTAVLRRARQALRDAELFARVSVGNTDLVNPPEEPEANIVPLSEDSTGIRGSSMDEGFFNDGVEVIQASPVINVTTHGMSIELSCKGEDMLAIMDLAGDVQAIIETDPELAKLVTSLEFQGSVPYQATGGNTPFVLVAVVFSFAYPTSRGYPAKAVLNN